MPLSIILVVGARPNFVKVAPLLHALAGLDDVRPSLLHTGQHYDWALSQAFIEQLGLPEPEDYLSVGSGSHAEQTAGVLVGVERVLEQRRPDALVVVGDVNSTMAAALAAPRPAHPSRIWNRGCARATGRCPRRSTGRSQTGYRTSCSVRPRTPSTTS